MNNSFATHDETMGGDFQLHIANLLFLRLNGDWNEIPKCTNFGNSHKKRLFSAILSPRKRANHSWASLRAMRWYCDGVRPVMRLNDETKVERDLKPTLSLMASMV